VQTFISLDGVMQGPGGPDEDRSGGFAHAGWLVPYFDEGKGRTMVDWTERADALLLGPRTYEILASHWPRVGGDDPIAAKLNSARKHVVSTTLDSADRNNVDEYRPMVFPVLVGSGRRLFADGTMPAALELAETATSSTGVAIHTYRRAGGLRTGSFAREP
jgi:dihydrofolate reductase